MLALDLHSAEVGKAVVGQLLDRGILINRTHDTVLRFLPPYIIQKKHVDEVVRALDAALGSVVGSEGKRRPARTGKPARRSQQ